MPSNSLHALRFYIGRPEGYARFWRIEETTTKTESFALNIVIHGLKEKRSTLVGRWPDRLYSAEELNSGITTPYGEMEAQQLPVDHFTLHANGAFQLRLANGIAPFYLG